MLVKRSKVFPSGSIARQGAPTRWLLHERRNLFIIASVLATRIVDREPPHVRPRKRLHRRPTPATAPGRALGRASGCIARDRLRLHRLAGHELDRSRSTRGARPHNRNSRQRRLCAAEAEAGGDRAAVLPGLPSGDAEGGLPPRRLERVPLCAERPCRMQHEPSKVRNSGAARCARRRQQRRQRPKLAHRSRPSIDRSFRHVGHDCAARRVRGSDAALHALPERRNLAEKGARRARPAQQGVEHRRRSWALPSPLLILRPGQPPGDGRQHALRRRADLLRRLQSQPLRLGA